MIVFFFELWGLGGQSYSNFLASTVVEVST